MKIAALIPARSGSVRVIDKNVKILEGDPLIGRKIKQLQSSCVDEIFLGSNDNKYLEIAEQYGATPITRSEFSCDERVSTSNNMIADFVKRIPNTFDLIVWAHCTNPFLYSRHYNDAIKLMLDNSGSFDSLLSVQKVQNHMWEKEEAPMNYNPWAPNHTLAKDLKPVYFQTGGIFIQWAENIRKNNYFFANKPKFIIHDSIEAMDIDTEYDFQFATVLAAGIDQKENFHKVHQKLQK